MKQSEPVKGTLEDFSNEFKSGQFSDCKVKCGDRVWNLHKFVLCSRSSFFKAAFTGGLQECHTSETTLQEQDPDRVHVMLEYIYSGTFSHTNDVEEVGSADPEAFTAYVEAIETYTQLYILADYLGLVNGCQEFYNRLETLLAGGAFLTAKSFEIFLTEDAIARLVFCASLLPPADDITNNDAGNSVSPGSVHRALRDFLHRIIDVFRLQEKPKQLRPLLQAVASSHPDLLVDLLLHQTSETKVSQNDPNSKPAPSKGYYQNDDRCSGPGTVSHPPRSLPPCHSFGGASLYSGLGSAGGGIPPLW
ncbi:BTB/POZ protein [Rhypophila decipiens]|uniref:BTB/POZ protein n=1 Tax=Rhypophila decipiens TaxID=261697 RepID=A0AAN6XXH0_9PEZI|nr:BTB/POZ protein [Rhypophila decipiens]